MLKVSERADRKGSTSRCLSDHICPVHLMTLHGRRFSLVAVALLAIAAGTVTAQRASSPTPTQAPAPDWVKRSNEHTRVVLQEQARLAPEGAAQLGLDGFDDQITNLSAGLATRARESLDRVQQDLQRRLAEEKDALVRQDLEILIESVRQQRHGFDVARSCCCRTSTRRRRSSTACARCSTIRCPRSGGVRRWCACASTPAQSRASSRSPSWPWSASASGSRRKSCSGRSRSRSSAISATSAFFASGIDELFKKYDMPDAAPLLATLKTQFAAYDKAVRADVLPRTRTDFKLPPALYASNLEQFGVDIPPADLAKMAHRAFDEIQKEMQTIAAAIGAEQGNPKADYRDGHPRAEEEAARRRCHPAPLPGATEAARRDHRQAVSW